MKTIFLEERLEQPIEQVWAVISDITRCDWVPGVDSISAENNVRTFQMTGIGEVQERIVSLDHQSHRLQYSAIKTPSGVDHHLATIQLSAGSEGGTQVSWTTEIAPDQFAVAIEPAMSAALSGLRKVLENPFEATDESQ